MFGNSKLPMNRTLEGSVPAERKLLSFEFVDENSPSKARNTTG